MDWFLDLLRNTDSVAHTVLLYSLVIASGVALGKIKFFGISLGVTFVLFMGILVSHFGFVANKTTLHFVQEFGLILFVFSVGMQVGPSFFTSFRKGGMQLNGMAASMILLNILVAVGLYYALQGRVSMPMMVGVLSGAVTNTPGLGAAQNTLNQLGNAEPIGLGYAVAYPLGVLGMIAAMMLIRVIFKIKFEKEDEEIKKQSTHSKSKPIITTLKVTNRNLFGKTVYEMKDLTGRIFVVSRVKHNDEICVPSEKTLIQEGDYLIMVSQAQDTKFLISFLGEEVEYDWDLVETEDKMVSHRAIVTNEKLNGKTIESLYLRSIYGVNITRVNRSGMDLVGSPDLALQIGDRVVIVGPEEGVIRAERLFGNSVKRLDEPNLIAIFVGIFLGIILGSIPLYIPNVPMPVKLGLAGGPLIVAILIGRFGYKAKLVTYTTQSANLILRELGICLFLASVGINSGGQFVKTVVDGDGVLWIGCGFLITIIPALTIGLYARLRHKLNYYTIIGLLAGSSTNPPALAYANTVSGNDYPAVAYTTVYPLTMFLRIITAQFLVLLFV